MSSSHNILEDFICPINTCPPEADLGNILKILRSSQHPTIAVVDDRQYPIGVINGSRLLASLLKQWSKVDLDSTESCDGEQIGACDDIADRFELTRWIEPIISLKSDLSLERLLSYLKQGVITEIDRKNYVVTDVEGKLLGLLDTFRFSQWLFTHQIKLDRYSSRQKIQTLSSSYLPIFKLIEQISVPLMLQTRSGSALYQNQYWQHQVGTTTISNPLEIKDFIKFFCVNSPCFESIPSQKELTPYCIKGNYYLSPSFADASPQNITFESQKILEVVTKKPIAKQVYVEKNEQLQSRNLELNSSYLPEAKAEWQYIKIPIKLTERSGEETSLYPLSTVATMEELSATHCLAIEMLSDERLYYTNSPPQIWLVIAIKLPLTEKLTHQQYRQNIELVKLNQLKDEFLASISHELKSPLTAIVGLSSLLKEEKLGRLNQRQIRYSELIYRSGKQLMKIVSDMLELTYLATGKLKLNLEPITIKSLCKEAYQQVVSRLEESSQFEGKALIKPQLVLSIDKKLEIVVADKIRLRQILIYLLENALKSIHCKEIKLSSQPKNIAITINYWSNWIAITIADNGIGISEETQHLLLEQCFQSENYLNHRYDDIGLKLILAQQLAKAHGGDISFISCSGIGSKFTVLLPSSSTKISSDIISNSSSIASLRQSLELSYQYHHPRQKPQENTIVPKNNLLVLLIDSVVAQINELDFKLKELGYYPIIARTATEALQKARQFKPSKILLNPSVSKLFDTEVLTLLKSDSLTSKIPVFLIVARDTEQENYTDADGFLTLPIKRKSLTKIIPSFKQDVSETQKPLTILHLYPESENTSHLKITQNSNLNFALNEHLSGLNHRVLEADSLEQGELLARIWQIDAIVLDGRILQEPLVYLRSLRKSASLSSLPLVTLDAKTTEAANLIKGLAVFPCLLPKEESNLANLVKVIQIAAGIGNNR